MLGIAPLNGRHAYISVSRRIPSTPTTSQLTCACPDELVCQVFVCSCTDRRMSNQIGMSVNKMGSVPDLTFVSINGPTLDKVNAKAMRAHTTRANFARRRRRLVRDYADQKENVARVKSLRIGEDILKTDHGLVVDIQHPIFSHPGLDYKLNRKDAFFIHHCM